MCSPSAIPCSPVPRSASAIGRARCVCFWQTAAGAESRAAGPRAEFKVGGSALQVGPYGALNFPWILLDRALGTFAYVINRAHARRDEATINSAQMKAAMEAADLATSRWEDATRRECERIFTAIRKKKTTREDREKLRSLIHARLLEVSARRLL